MHDGGVCIAGTRIVKPQSEVIKTMLSGSSPYLLHGLRSKHRHVRAGWFQRGHHGTEEMMQPLSNLPACHLFGCAVLVALRCLHGGELRCERE